MHMFTLWHHAHVHCILLSFIIFMFILFVLKLCIPNYCSCNYSYVPIFVLCSYCYNVYLRWNGYCTGVWGINKYAVRVYRADNRMPLFIATDSSFVYFTHACCLYTSLTPNLQLLYTEWCRTGSLPGPIDTSEKYIGRHVVPRWQCTTLSSLWLQALRISRRFYR